MARLTNATKARHTDVQRDLERVDAAIAADERTLERFADSVATWLRSHRGLRDSDLDDVFRILNPHLLGGVLGTGEGDVHVIDADRLVAALRQVAASFGADGFASAGVVVPRAALHADSPLARFADVEALRDRVEQARTRRADLAQTLADIRQRDAIERQRASADSELEAARTRLRDWEAWQLSKDEAREHEAHLEQLGRQITDAEREAHQLRQRQTEVALDLRELERVARERRAEYESALADVRRLTAPPQDWEGAEEASGAEAASLQELASGYRRRWADHGDVARRLEHLFSDVAHQTAERYVAADEVATIALLRDELEALADRERSVEELWAGLVDGMRNAFKGLLEGVDELKRQVSTLNQKLNRRQISNLEQVELELQPVQDMLQRLRAVLEAENAPLFSGPEGRSRAARDIALWMQDRPRIDLIDLINLRFRVVDRAGRTKTFTSLSQIESQGTSTTIKVLVHLELLKSMLTNDPVSIPFFLDEVATLDDANLRGLIEHAKGMGFVPVVASPKPSDAAETLYFLRQGPGGLILDETSRLVIERTTDGT